MQTTRLVLRWLAAILFVAAGVVHFVAPGFYVESVPDVMPWPRFWVAFTGAAEIAGGVGLLVPKLRRAAAAGLVAMLLGFLWVHIDMVIEPPIMNGEPIPMWMLVARIPLQFVFIAWIWWAGWLPARGDAGTPRNVTA